MSGRPIKRTLRGAGQAGMPTRAGRIVLDMDSSESPVHGAQEGSAYNGHFESVCYHPLFLFNEHGDCVAATLRPGNVHSADDWDDLLVSEIERQQVAGTRVAFRADAAFAKPEIYDALEQRDVDYAIRMPSNKSLELDIEDLLFRPPGRPSRKPLVRYKSFRYQAKSSNHAQTDRRQGGAPPRCVLLQTSRDVLRRDTPQDAARRRDRRGCSTRGKLWHRPSDGPIRKVFAASHHNLLPRSEWWLEVDLGQQKTMRAPHRIELDAHERGLRLAHHLILQLARQPVCDHRWAGVSLGGTHWPTDSRSSGIASLQERGRGTR